MNDSTLLKMPSIRAALGALGVAVLVFGWTVVRAMRAEPLPPVAPMAIASLDAITHRAERPAVDLKAAVENDLFSPDRTPPPGSYRLPGEAGPNDKPVAAEAQRPTVLGTAVATDGRSFATVQLGDGGPKLVHVGDRIGEWVVRGIQRGKVTLVSDAGTRADLGVSAASPRPPGSAADADPAADTPPNAFMRGGGRGRRGGPPGVPEDDGHWN